MGQVAPRVDQLRDDVDLLTRRGISDAGRRVLCGEERRARDRRARERRARERRARDRRARERRAAAFG